MCHKDIKNDVTDMHDVASMIKEVQKSACHVYCPRCTNINKTLSGWLLEKAMSVYCDLCRSDEVTSVYALSYLYKDMPITKIASEIANMLVLSGLTCIRSEIKTKHTYDRFSLLLIDGEYIVFYEKMKGSSVTQENRQHVESFSDGVAMLSKVKAPMRMMLITNIESNREKCEYHIKQRSMPDKFCIGSITSQLHEIMTQ